MTILRPLLLRERAKDVNREGLAGTVPVFERGTGGGFLPSSLFGGVNGFDGFAHVAQTVERVLGKDEVTSSILVMGSRKQSG